MKRTLDGDVEMTKLQTQACHLIEQLSEETLVDVVAQLKELAAKKKTEEERLAEQKAERQKRHDAYEELMKLREELIAMDIDWEAEKAAALKEKYGA